MVNKALFIKAIAALALMLLILILVTAQIALAVVKNDTSKRAIVIFQICALAITIVWTVLSYP
jgi:hypothetical protein